jgi:hypothetical protein
MDAANPYAPPTAPLADGAAPRDRDADLAPWLLEGRLLSARHGATLPDVCLFTGETTGRNQRLRHPLSWTPLWFRIMAVLYPGIAMATYPHFRRSSMLGLGLGAAGRTRQRAALWLYASAVICGALIVLSPKAGSGPLIGLLFLLFGVCFAGILLARPFVVAKIDRQYVRLRVRPNVARAFARLPPPAAPPPV